MLAFMVKTLGTSIAIFGFLTCVGAIWYPHTPTDILFTKITGTAFAACAFGLLAISFMKDP
jgi:hypothetical protein